MSVFGIVLSSLILVIVITSTILLFRSLGRRYRDQAVGEKSDDSKCVRWASPKQANKRKIRATWFVAVGYSASALWLLFAAFGGSQRDTAWTISTLLLPVALVGINVGWPLAVFAPFAKDQAPLWRRIAMFTVMLWGIFLASVSASGILAGASAILFAFAFVTLPTLLAFPVWLLVAFIKQRKTP